MKDHEAVMKARDAIIREQWVQIMMKRLVAEELGKCYRREGVNHLEKCGKYRGMFCGSLGSPGTKAQKLTCLTRPISTDAQGEKEQGLLGSTSFLHSRCGRSRGRSRDQDELPNSAAGHGVEGFRSPAWKYQWCRREYSVLDRTECIAASAARRSVHFYLNGSDVFEFILRDRWLSFICAAQTGDHIAWQAVVE